MATPLARLGLLVTAAALVACYDAGARRTSDQCRAPSPGGLCFDGQGQHASLGAVDLDLSRAHSLEAWVYWEGQGWRAPLGTTGATLIPIVGLAQGGALPGGGQWRYVLGVDAARGVFAAERGLFTRDASGELDPAPRRVALLTGATAAAVGAWHHVALTSDGSAWRLYQNGQLDAEAPWPASGLDAPAAAGGFQVSVGTVLDATAQASGALAGCVDELRLWSRTLDGPALAASLARADAALGGAAGDLVGCWPFDEGSGYSTRESLSGGWGELRGATWGAPGAPFVPFPGVALTGPLPGAQVAAEQVQLGVHVTGAPGRDLALTFWGRQAALEEDFALVVLPDTQAYVLAAPEGFLAQTRWVMAHADASNIRAVLHVGDVVQSGDGEPAQWAVADRAMSLLEAPLPGRPWGLPYGLAVGNHDQSPEGDPRGSTRLFNTHFGPERFAGRDYYGGHFGADNDNSFIRFVAGGRDFLALFLEYGGHDAPGPLEWADALLAEHPRHTAIVVSHSLLNGAGTGAAPWTGQGYATYEALKNRPGLALLLGGHILGEGYRSDAHRGGRVLSLLADYQGRDNGGDGWLRLLLFSPGRQELWVRTYSPTLERFETDADSDLRLPWSPPALDFEVLATPTLIGADLAQVATVPWAGLSAGSHYEWFVSAESCGRFVATPIRSFQTR